MTNSPVEEIKNRLDIVEVVGSYVKLQKAGINLRASCPFHSEKKPSFFVSPSRQMWHCFGGCGEGGDIFKFVMKIEGLEFLDALRLLAQKAGVQLKREKPELRTQRQRLYEICELAASFFEKQLEKSKAGQAVQKYLLKRGIAKESIKKWRLGYAPNLWQGLSDFLVGKGYQREEIIKAGLAIQKEENSSTQHPVSNIQSYDRFRSRIIFPVFDLNSQVIGFGGRVFGEAEKTEVAKYMNIPNTLLYDKSRVLYGLNEAKLEIRKKQECFLVEGYTDVILMSQVGFQNVVATSGTALTASQLKILQRYTENLLTAFDMDLAGDSATKKGIELAQAMGFNIKVLLLPEGEDPADVASKDPELLGKLINKTRSILDFYFETTFSRYDSKTPEGKKTIARILLPVIKRIPNNIERSFWVQQLAKRLEVREEDVVEELKRAKSQVESYFSEPEDSQNNIAQNNSPKSRRELLEDRFLALILKFPEHLEALDKANISFFSPRGQAIFTGLKNGSAKTFGAEFADYFNYLSFKSEVEEIEEKEILPEIQFCLKEIQFLEIKSKLNQISQDLRKAEAEKNLSKIDQLTKQFHQLSKTMVQLS